MKTDRKRILVVDDDESHLTLASELLQDGAFEVHTRQSGFGILEAMSKFQPHLVLLDMMMPGLPGTGWLPCSSRTMKPSTYRSSFIRLWTKRSSAHARRNAGCRGISARVTSAM